MLKKILSADSCAECRGCCVFECYDIFETPIFSAENRNFILEKNPRAVFSRKGKGYVFVPQNPDSDGLFGCPALSENGCILGDSKPFECRIFPYKIMNLDGRLVIAISPCCEEIYKRPLSELVNFLKSGLSEKIFSYALTHPEIVTPYSESCPILLVGDFL